MSFTKQEICEDKFGSGVWPNLNDDQKNLIYRVMDEWAEDVAIDYAHWLFERAFSRLMERPDREGRKLFAAYQKNKP